MLIAFTSFLGKGLAVADLLISICQLISYVIDLEAAASALS